MASRGSAVQKLGVSLAIGSAARLLLPSTGFVAPPAQRQATQAAQLVETRQAQAPATPGASGAPGTAALTGAAAVAMVAAGARRLPGRSAGVAAAAEAAAGEAPPKPKKVRISAFDSIRFFLITYIVCGHFIGFAAPSAFATNAITQINVVVGAFFVLSGYVTAYTSTENAERAASPKLLSTPAQKWILPRVFGYYPLHLFVLLIFSPMFLFSDVTYSGWPTAIWHGFLAVTMTQAWFPMHAEVWNAPTWFLSALTFATAVMPFALPPIAKMSKEQLKRAGLFLFMVGLLPKLAWCYDHNAWGLLEGAMSPRALPNLAIFNTQRFSPFMALVEVLLGVVACRVVMLDGAEGEEPAPKTTAMSTILPLVGMVAIILLRATGVITLSDMLTRAVIFIPLFLAFLMAAHRASVKTKVDDPIVNILSSKLLVTLGGLAFPIFVVHGPLGQLFYKKLIATKLFGGPLNVVCGPWFFYVYLAITIGCAWLLQKGFMTNKKVGEMAKSACGKLSNVF